MPSGFIRESAFCANLLDVKWPRDRNSVCEEGIRA